MLVDDEDLHKEVEVLVLEVITPNMAELEALEHELDLDDLDVVVSG